MMQEMPEEEVLELTQQLDLQDTRDDSQLSLLKREAAELKNLEGTLKKLKPESLQEK